MCVLGFFAKDADDEVNYYDKKYYNNEEEYEYDYDMFKNDDEINHNHFNYEDDYNNLDSRKYDKRLR